MSTDSFVHLHLHTEYSILESMVRIEDLMKKAVEFGMPAVAITDHGNLYGAIEFYRAANSAGIKPIIGCEVHVARGSHKAPGSGSFHFTLLAKDNMGYRNLVKLVSIAHLEGSYDKPWIDKELLASHAAGLIGLSGCLKSELNMALTAGQGAKARNAVADYRDIFGAENFYLELQRHGIDQQEKNNAALRQLAKEFGLGLVASNDVHFLEREHHDAHDVMTCIGTGGDLADETRRRYPPELYFKSPAEMRELFANIPEAVENTLAIAERCELELEHGKLKYPTYVPPAGKTREQVLRELAFKGLRRRYGAHPEAPELTKRLEYELSVLEENGFVSYFLLLWDIIHYAKRRGIPVGPGRGSAPGALIAYVLEITDVDPIRFGLLFERFLNPEEVSPPDIDVDVCKNRRGEVIDYIRQKYGERSVAQIVTFGTLGAKSVVRAVGRVMGLTSSYADRIAKMIPNELMITLNSAVEKNPDLKKAVETEPETRRLWEYATMLEGLTRNIGVHAAGVVIADCDLTEYIPLTRARNGSIVSEYSIQQLTELGLLKMDFLELKTLTVIDDTEELVRRHTPAFAVTAVPLDDQPTFDLLNRAETIGIFQLDGGMASWCKQFDFRSLDDIYALSALYRPGPMEFIPDFIKRKKRKTRIKYLHPLLEKVCGDTYGIMIYQEQVMEAARVLAGYTLAGADLLRRAMGKKDVEKMDRERKNFVEGCRRTNEIDEKTADAIFALLEKFASNVFNKSHSAAYGWISYQTAYLKANWPLEFMTASLNHAVGNPEKTSELVAECQRMGIVTCRGTSTRTA